MRTIKNTVAVVTGAGSGIGRALAQNLASQGARLALADVNSKGLEETQQSLGSAESRTYLVDVSKAPAVEAFAHDVERDFGGAALLVNNAGVALQGSFLEISLEDMEWLMGINFWGVVYGCRFFLPSLLRAPEAHLVNISSVFGLISPPGQAAYSSAKFAVRGLTEVLRQELRSTNVKVTCVHPGGIKTSIAKNARTGAGADTAHTAHMRDRFDQVAKTSSEKAASVIMNGVLRDKPRVLIGADAVQVDILQRLFPSKASGIFTKGLVKRMGTEAPSLAAVPRKT
ncbi:MAG TPA: SDR family NAD(P)-dependent oxidoreductase [Candidatus Angelobacter sp.]|jgi:NAD(P)-dependent dehydrogenase (short-subunit alcohol dehydrogenase family)|nr:SDR family NAD(P)-dependent oxidoreductase [Candidatus Angelobacter sp.]